MAALAAERRRQRLIRRVITLGVAIIGVAFVIVLISRLSDDGSGTTSNTSTTLGPTATTAPAATGSAAGKPCVPVSDPLPPGAPEIPVDVGPPPAALVTKDVTVGTGADVPAGSSVTVNYIGVACSTGTIFDFSYGKEPITFSLTGVIKGWTDGIPGMKVGGKRVLGIPAAQAYGAQGNPRAGIAPDEPLWFVVEVLEVKPA